MQGRRVECTENGLPKDEQPGDYWFWEGIWWAEAPNGFIANLSNHTVTENPDGTITVQPSILVWRTIDGQRQDWHGYLENGIWREC